MRHAFHKKSSAHGGASQTTTEARATVSQMQTNNAGADAAAADTAQTRCHARQDRLTARVHVRRELARDKEVDDEREHGHGELQVDVVTEEQEDPSEKNLQTTIQPRKQNRRTRHVTAERWLGAQWGGQT